VDTYEYKVEQPLDCPIHVFGGDSDIEVDRKGLVSWDRQTRGEFALETMPGDHFYLQKAWRRLIDAISTDLKVASYV
jgi:surfactin synthase thioesterase subunit